MDEMMLRQIIQKLLSDCANKKALVLVTGGSAYSPQIYDILKNQKGVQYDCAMSESSKSMEALENWKTIGNLLEGIETIYESVKEAEYIILPFMTRNTLAKVATGIADNDITTAIQLGIMMNKKIIALDSSWNPETEMGKLMKLDKNPIYTKMLNQHKVTLESFGIQFVNVYELEDALTYCMTAEKQVIETTVETQSISQPAVEGDLIEKPFITQKDLADKKKVQIKKGSKLTEMAKEYILENQIEVIEL